MEAYKQILDNLFIWLLASGRGLSQRTLRFLPVLGVCDSGLDLGQDPLPWNCP